MRFDALQVKLIISDVDGVIRYQADSAVLKAYQAALKTTGVTSQRLKHFPFKTIKRLRTLPEAGFLNERNAFLKLLVRLSRENESDFKKLVESAKKGDVKKIREYFEKSEADESKRISESVLKKMNEAYEKHRYSAENLRATKPFKKSVGALQALIKNGFSIVLSSNAPKASVKNWVDIHAPALAEKIEILGKEDVERQKPDPEGILKALGGMHAEKAISVGDHPEDIKAAKNAGVTAVAVLSPLASVGELLKHEPDYVFHSFKEMTEWLLGVRRVKMVEKRSKTGFITMVSVKALKSESKNLNPKKLKR